MQQELQQSLQQGSLQFSDVCDSTEPGTHFPTIARRGRLQYMVDMGIDLGSYSPLVVKMACDGVYRYSARQGDELRKLAAEYATAGGSFVGVGRGTTFARLVKSYRDVL